MFNYNFLSKSFPFKNILKIIVGCFFFFISTLKAQEKGLPDFNKTIEDCKSYLDKSGKAYNNANYEAFKKYNDSALLVSQKLNLKKLEIKAIINHGIYYNVVDAYEKALEQFYKALEFNEKTSDKEVTKINILVNLANVYSQMDNTDKVISCMEEVLLLSEKNQVSDLIKVAAYNGLGNSYTKKKDYEKALTYLHEVKTIGERIQHFGAVLTALDNIGYSYFQQEKWDEVIKAAKESVAYSTKHSLDRRPVSLLNFGMAYVKKKTPKEAIPYLKEVLDIAIVRKDLNLEKEAHYHLAKAYKLLGNFRNSNREQELYAEVMKRLLKEQSNAALLDLKHDANAEKQVIKSRLESLTVVDNNKNKMLIFSGFIVVFLGVLLFFYIRKKKVLETDREQFEKTNELLNNENKALKTKMKELAIQKEQNSNELVPYKNSSLTEQDRNQYMEQILDYMEKEKPYLDFDINQSELASKLSMNKHHLSEVLNLCFDKNFYQFINLYRVNEAQKIIKDPTYSDYKILAIAYEAGFKSKTSFNRVFKNHTGLTPSEYRKKQLKSTVSY
ncbi:AraC family transcriptional regulator [Tenacibaculum caenipelagi]|uniref:AraC-like DNA-binding protein n=1 Tax=Tenacibaculum caenipelagi TaxID=1325435 RepID=A0A4R6TAU5_9FLAO|nr:AraC family transcriptional regulator [Tenacibaculum caenipelagi]TDQ24026.1 AraC-like DNA-binding protein [Tenacibaculum caenipelagi]